MKALLILSCALLSSCAAMREFIIANEPAIEETIVYGTRQLVRAGTAKLKTSAKNPADDVQP